MKHIDDDTLAAAIGGNSIFTDPNYCTPDNPEGRRIYHQSVRNPPPAIGTPPDPRDTWFPGVNGRPPTREQMQRFGEGWQRTWQWLRGG